MNFGKVELPCVFLPLRISDNQMVMMMMIIIIIMIMIMIMMIFQTPELLVHHIQPSVQRLVVSYGSLPPLCPFAEEKLVTSTEEAV